MDDLPEGHQFDSSFFCSVSGSLHFTDEWPAEQGFIAFSTDVEVSDIM